MYFTKKDPNRSVLCNSLLQSTERFLYEEVDGSTCSSDKNQCHNEKCDLYMKSYWNDYGEFFNGGLEREFYSKHFPTRKYAALGSFAKQQEVEIYAHGLKQKKYLSPWLTLRWLQPYIEYKYKGDTEGNVLGRTWKLKFLKKDEEGKYFYGYSSDLSSLKFYFKYFRKKLKDHRKRNTEYTKKELLEMFRKRYNDLWYAKLFQWYIRTFYKGLMYNLIKETKTI